MRNGLRIAALTAFATALLVAPSAQGKSIVVGANLSAAPFPAGCGGTSCTIVDLAVAGPGTVATAPVDGTIVRWRLIGATATPGFALRVLRPSGETYIGVGTSPAQTPASPGLQTYPVNMPIKAGDHVGLDIPAGGEVGFRLMSGLYGGWIPALPDGGPPQPMAATQAGEVLVNADIAVTPAVDLIAPASGPIAGGTLVQVAGTSFEGATAVRFGDQPASFTVDSDTRLTALAPKGAAVGPVDITVTTPDGTSAASAKDLFTYKGCVVPKLKGKKLKAVRKALTKANCKLGKVKGEKGRKARAKKQSAKPGTVRPPGAKVTVTVG